MDYHLNELVKQITCMTIERRSYHPDYLYDDGSLLYGDEKTKTTIFPDGSVTCEHYVRTKIHSRLKKGAVTNWSVDPEEVRKAYEKVASFLFRPTHVVNYVDDTDGSFTLYLGAIKICIPRELVSGDDDLYAAFWAFSEPEEISKQEG